MELKYPNFPTAQRSAGLPRLICVQSWRIRAGRRTGAPNPPLASAGGHMRIVQILAFGVFVALLVACGAWTLAWFGTSSGAPNAIQAAPEPNSPKSTVLEVAPESQSSGEIPAAPERKSVSATIHLN